MKHLFSLALLLGLVAAGCQNQPSPGSNKPDTPPKTDCSQTPDNAGRVLANLVTARRNIYSYDSLCHKHWDGIPPIESYTIRAVDLLAAMGMPTDLADSAMCRFKHIRVYLGFQDKVGFKLYIVPVTGACLQDKNPSKWTAGRDVILNKDANPIIVPIDSAAIAETDRYVLDLNAPCPKTCPIEPTVKADR
ncbi:hypothetical protein HHL17_10985 [Chitinophaga sp. G-6-1-13]|uniref:Lipoprotein n=1 Tax=Chitinophaga fulva TaxID=2728842 RepID=A0A848GP72_9BACT|nr:hypothetical protein [Chitinophaga fulva]NML37718.1 hypothetical protein [Chitinophaga fulva]